MKAILSKLIAGILLCLISSAVAQCSADTSAFESGLIVVGKDNDGFATRLGMPEELEDLPYILLDCAANTEVTVTISEPVRVPKTGPELAGPLESYVYNGSKSYRPNQRLRLEGPFEDLPLRVRMVLSNKNKILLASDNYQYTVSLDLTTVTSEPELGAEMFNSLRTAIDLTSKISKEQAPE